MKFPSRLQEIAALILGKEICPRASCINIAMKNEKMSLSIRALLDVLLVRSSRVEGLLLSGCLLS